MPAFESKVDNSCFVNPRKTETFESCFTMGDFENSLVSKPIEW